MSEDQILQELERYGDEGADDGDTSEEEAPQETEPTEDDAAATPEGEEEAEPKEGEESEDPEDDASEPEPAKTQDDDDETGTRVHRLRDGTQVTLADLKKGFDKAREYDRVLPQVQQEYQKVQQEKQQFAAQQQQFQAYASHVAQTALGFLPPEPDAALMDENSGKYDPIAFMQARHRREAAVADFNAKFQGVAQAAAQTSQQAQQQAVQQVQQERQTAVQRFFRAYPDLQAPEKGQEFIKDFHAVADAVGYTREERQDIRDPRLYSLTMLAARGLKAMQAEHQQKTVTTQRQSIAAKKVAAAPPVAPPAARQTASARDARAMQGSVERLRKNPSSTQAALDALAQFE
jgi:hypothetical protein